MSPGIAHYTFLEQLRLNRTLRSVTAKYGNLLASRDRDALREATAVLEAAVKSKPREWIYWCVLGDWYQTIGELVKSMRACEKCYELRPRDPRSAYALGTALRILTRAKYVGDPRNESVKEWMAESGLATYVDFNPEESQKALQELGMTLDQAAERSLALFEEVLTLRVRGQEAKHVRDTLAAMYSEFPHLEERVRSTRQAPKGLLAEARGEPFNEAADHYQKLRYLMGRPDQYKRELLEIIRLCQLAIAKSPRNGDAYVLLANALVQAAGELRFVNDEAYDYFLMRAGAVIQHWASSRIHTRNRKLGLELFQSIKDEIGKAKALTSTELEQRMEAFRDTLLPDVLKTEALSKFRERLGSLPPMRKFSPMPRPAIPVSTYQGAGITMKYPTGWELEPHFDENSVLVWAPSQCGWIQLAWGAITIPDGASGEDLYSVTRTLLHEDIIETRGHYEKFEILREYRLRDGPVFEFQFRDYSGMNKVQRHSYLDTENRLHVDFRWICIDLCSEDEYKHDLYLKDTLFDLLAQSATFGD